MKNLAGVSAKYIGKPYEQYGCLELVYHLLKDLQLPVPDTIGSWSVDNYRGLVDADIKKAQRIMIRAFKKIGQRGSTQYPTVGNLLVVFQKPDIFFPAVYTGNGQAMASFIKKGIVVFGLDELNRVVMTRSLDPEPVEGRLV